jgi:hypothetical protein
MREWIGKGLQQLGQTLQKPRREDIEEWLAKNQRAIETGRWCEAILNSPHWQWYQSDSLEKRIEQLNDELASTDPEQKTRIARLQGERTGISNVISRLNLFVNQGKEAEAELEQYRKQQSGRKPVTGRL